MLEPRRKKNQVEDKNERQARCKGKPLTVLYIKFANQLTSSISYDDTAMHLQEKPVNSQTLIPIILVTAPGAGNRKKSM